MSEALTAAAPKVILAKPHFWAPGEFKLLGDNHQLVVVPFRAQFHRLSTSQSRLVNLRLAAMRMDNEELEAVLRSASWLAGGWHTRVVDATPEQLPGVLAEFRMGDQAFLDTVLKDWDLLDLPGGEGLAYSAEARAQVFDQWEGLEGAFCRAYFDAKKLEHPEKNSVTPSAAS